MVIELYVLTESASEFRIREVEGIPGCVNIARMSMMGVDFKPFVSDAILESRVSPGNLLRGTGFSPRNPKYLGEFNSSKILRVILKETK